MGKILYSCNGNFFQNIDTEEKAYWLGFLYADGSIVESSHHMCLVLSSNDKEHLIEFNKSIESTYPIKIERDKYVKLKISNKHMGDTLISKGCVPRKSLILKFPSCLQVPECLIRHFIRGYFDGDGCICNQLNSKNYFRSKINILGTYDFLYGITLHLPVENIMVHQRNGYKIHEINIYNKKDIINVMHYLYDDATIYLKRKYNKFLEVEQYVNMRSVLLTKQDNP